MGAESMAALTAVAQHMIDATSSGDDAVIQAATTIAVLVEQRKRSGLPLNAGAEDVLPALHDALGASMTAMMKLNNARLSGFKLARALGILGDEVGPACPCGGAISPADSAAPALVLVEAGQARAA